MRKNLLILALLLCGALNAQQNFTQYVNPMIGTGDHGHVFLGANVPFGMVDAGPTQQNSGWDWCSGYHYSGTSIVGFAQTHLSGTGCSDLGDVALMPTQGDVTLSRDGLASTYRHEDEQAAPGYYSVLLQRFGIRTEITATRRTALYRFTYPKAEDQRLVVDLNNGIGDHVQLSRLTRLNDSTFVGYRISHGWANEQHLYFAIKVNRPALKGSEENDQIHQLRFAPSPEPLLVRVALSPVSELNAMLNMDTEDETGWNFEAQRQQADQAWNEQLGRIEATFMNDRDRTIFYTALFHFMVAPQTWDDTNGDWRGSDNRIYRGANGAKGGDNLTTLSLWDTYRAAAPLSTLLLPEMMPAIATTYLRIFRTQGKLPVWHLMSQETNCMVGCPAVPVLADLYLKGYIAEQDKKLALQAMVSSLLMNERGLGSLRTYGYLPYDKEGESLAKTLEYYLADWSAAQALRKAMEEGKSDDVLMGDYHRLGKLTAFGLPEGMTWNITEMEVARMTVAQLADYFSTRCQGYRRLFDPRVRCMRSLDSQGQFKGIDGFNPAYQTGEYTEGNPWQYTWLVPHDIQGLVATLGGRKAFEARLDSLFTAPSELNAEANPDITGLVGQYAHGNEPSHHIAYIYSMIGSPKKTARLVRQIMRELYTDQPAGLCGNEDVGQMSAWYLLSALGFYQVEPCGGRYIVGSPIVKEATVHLAGDKTLTIRTHGNSDKAIYVSKVVLNGQTINDFTLRHTDLVQGGTLDVYMRK